VVGHPATAADAIIKAVQADSPPFNLVMGKDGLMRVRAKFAGFTRSLDTWESVSLSADFPTA
jgi:hypothetical protein